MIFVKSKFSQPLPESFDSVDAGQDQPVVVGDISKCRVQRAVRSRLTDFDEGDFQNFRAEITQVGGECAGLVASTSDENPQTIQR